DFRTNRSDAGGCRWFVEARLAGVKRIVRRKPSLRFGGLVVHTSGIFVTRRAVELADRRLVGGGRTGGGARTGRIHRSTPGIRGGIAGILRRRCPHARAGGRSPSVRHRWEQRRGNPGREAGV